MSDEIRDNKCKLCIYLFHKLFKCTDYIYGTIIAELFAQSPIHNIGIAIVFFELNPNIV